MKLTTTDNYFNVMANNWLMGNIINVYYFVQQQQQQNENTLKATINSRNVQHIGTPYRLLTDIRDI